MKTKCKCGICGLETSGNKKWKLESDMWDHIRDDHKAEYQKFHEERNELYKKISALQKSIPSLYSTEQRGEVKKGNWII